MTHEGNSDIERRLKALTPKPAPPALRQKVLQAAARRKGEEAWTTPRLRWALAGCAAVLAVIFITDAGLSRRQQDRLQGFLDGSRLTQTQAGDENSDLAEVLGKSVGRNLLVQNELAVVQQTRAEQVRREKILKELMTEDFDGNDSQKNNH